MATRPAEPTASFSHAPILKELAPSIPLGGSPSGTGKLPVPPGEVPRGKRGANGIRARTVCNIRTALPPAFFHARALRRARARVRDNLEPLQERFPFRCGQR